VIASPFCTAGVVKKFRKLHLDLIHLQAAYTLGIFGIKLGKALGVPVIMTCHTDIVSTWGNALGCWSWLLGGIVRRASMALTLYLFRNTERIIVPSKFTRDSLQGYGVDPKKIVIIPTPVEAPKDMLSMEEARKKRSLPRDKTILLFVGRISTDKNLDMLMKAFQMVEKQDQNTILVLAGGGMYSLKIRWLVWRMKLKGKVILTGAVPYEEIYDYYAACDLFVFASILESQGLTPLEALTAGKPVVVVNDGGIKEYVTRSHGFLTRNDPVEFAEACLTLSKNPWLRNRLGEQGRLDMATTLSPEVVYPCQIELYKKVLGGK
jgi:glycosyltransferase involved in cell wall biosynthesis